MRTPLLQPLRAGERTLITIGVRAPKKAGKYRFSARIVVEGVRWIEASDDVHLVEIAGGALHPDDDLNRFEERLRSQNGEDGIIRELLLRVGSPARYMVEVGAGDGTENNSALLIERYNFAARLIEGDIDRARRLTQHHASRKDVTVVQAFVDAESIVNLLSDEAVPPEPDILSIDIDGNDHCVWQTISRVLRPRIVVIEYNASKGPAQHWIMPYDRNHRWQGGDHFGASLAALAKLGTELGYALVGTDSSGVNAFFVRDDLLKMARFPRRSPEDAYHPLRSTHPRPATSSSDIRDSYTRGYYVNSCGGHADFGSDDPLSIADARLRSTASFAEIRPGRRALDLGCGRGEIVAYLAARGWTVDGVDYSADAIALATEHVERTRVPKDRVRLYNQDFDSFTFESDTYDLVIAADVIEHVSSVELARLYASVAKSLRKDGLFVLHTFPNAWYYQHEWPRQRRLAKVRGEELPEDPRTHFERAMHINEQSPRTLARQLRTSFPNVAIWVGDALDPFRSDVTTSSHTALRKSPDIFAVAGHTPIKDVTESDAFLGEPVSGTERSKIRITAAAPPQRMDDGGWVQQITVDNYSATTLSSAGRAPVLLSYHWLDKAGAVVTYNGLRTPLGRPLRPGETMTRRVLIAPAPPTGSVIRVTLVQEGVSWFDGDGVCVDVTVA